MTMIIRSSYIDNMLKRIQFMTYKIRTKVCNTINVVLTNSPPFLICKFLSLRNKRNMKCL